MSGLDALSFSQRLEYQKSFESWCIGNTKLAPTFATAIVWMQATHEGRKLVKELYKWIENREKLAQR